MKTKETENHFKREHNHDEENKRRRMKKVTSKNLKSKEIREVYEKLKARPEIIDTETEERKGKRKLRGKHKVSDCFDSFFYSSKVRNKKR